MIEPPLPADETARLAALDGYGAIDPVTQNALDSLVELAAVICGTPTAVISLVEGSRQRLLAKIGIAVAETPRDVSFCGHTILADRVMVVEDARTDERFFDNPLVVGAPNIRFYAGAPLLTISQSLVELMGDSRYGQPTWSGSSNLRALACRHPWLAG